MKTLVQIMKAVYVSFIGIFVYTFVIFPLKIWLSSVDFLKNQYDQGDIILRFSLSEMKVLSWISLFFNIVIFLSYLIGIGLIFSLFFKDFSEEELWGKFIFVFIVSYFSPILLSFVKEMISLRLLTYFKLENLDGKIK